MDQSLVVESLQQLRRTIRRVVVHHDDIKLEVRFLGEGTVHSVADGLLTVKDGNHHRRLHVELLFVEVRTAIERGIDLGTDLSQMGCSCLFHLYLHLTVAWVHIVELLHTRGTCVCLLLCVELLVDVEDASVTTQEEAQGIESCMLIGMLFGLGGKSLEQRGLDKDQRAEVEVIADTAQLIVDHGVGLPLALDDVEVVGIHHRRIRIKRHAHDPVEGPHAKHQLGGFGLQQHVVGFRLFRHACQRLTACQIACRHLLTVLEVVSLFSCQWFRHQQEYTLY